MQFNTFRRHLKSCTTPLHSWIANDRGNVSLIFGMAAIPLVAVGTMAVDYSNGVRLKTEIQAAADAAVLAAATAMASNQDDVSKVAVAEDTFDANLSDNSRAAFTAVPNTDVDFDNRVVTMTVAVATDQLVTRLLADKININVTAKAKVDDGNPICLMSLNPHAKESLYINGTADVLADGCSVHVNSDDDEALRQVGSGQATAESFCVRGDYDGSNYSPMPEKNCVKEEDPLEEYFDTAWSSAAINAAACTDITTLFGKKNGNNAPSEVKFLEPGVYCGDLEVQSGDTLVLLGSKTSEMSDPNHSQYVFVNGDITVQSGGTLRNYLSPSDPSIVDGLGNIVNSGKYTWPSQQTLLMTGASPAGEINVLGGGNIEINAKASGNFAGIAIAQTREAVPSKPHLITGGGDVNINGIVYIPTQPLDIRGNGVIGANASQFAIMADTIDIQGTGTLEIRIGADYQAAGLPELPEAQNRVRLVQ